LGEHAKPDPPIDVFAIAHELSVTVRLLAAPDDLSGFFFRDPASGEAMIGINSSHHDHRQRFTLAHELGHMILHSYDDVHYDRKGYGYGYGRVMMRDSSSSTGENRDEVEANFFAAELLMPRAMVYKHLLSGQVQDYLEEDFSDTVKHVAKEFGVSQQALSIRLVQLGIVITE
jgi:Zn-dependent peptidase ImmA (M78 family)